MLATKWSSSMMRIFFMSGPEKWRPRFDGGPENHECAGIPRQPGHKAGWRWQVVFHGPGAPVGGGEKRWATSGTWRWPRGNYGGDAERRPPHRHRLRS